MTQLRDDDVREYFAEMIGAMEADPAAPTGLVALFEALADQERGAEDALLEAKAMPPSERAASRAYLVAHREDEAAVGHPATGQVHELLNAILE